MAYLAEIGRGFEHRGARVPIMPGASLFDLLNGGDKAWGRKPIYWELGFKAAATAAVHFALGTAGRNGLLLTPGLTPRAPDAIKLVTPAVGP